VEDELAKRKFYAIMKLVSICIGTKPILLQQIAFRKKIQLAKHYKLPIVIHCREAFNEIFEILEEEKSDDLFGIFSLDV
jgi:TatD DNase family protein